MNYVFGPIPSRRLGLSLGVDIIPKKTCSLDCVYCELGPTDKRALRRKEYVPTGAVIAEIQDFLLRCGTVDYITFSGSGEPTLHSNLGDMIHSIKRFSNVPIAVITNSTLFHLEDVRRDLIDADIVLPSLDAATNATFEQINRPHPKLRLESIVDGLIQFRREFRRMLWLEILLVRGINDTIEELHALKEAVDRINPDRIQLNTVVRPPTMDWAQPLGPAELESIRRFFGDRCETISVFDPDAHHPEKALDAETVLAILHRRAMTVEDLRSALDAQKTPLRDVLSQLERAEVIRSFEFQGRTYYEAVEIDA